MTNTYADQLEHLRGTVGGALEDLRELDKAMTQGDYDETQPARDEMAAARRSLEWARGEIERARKALLPERVADVS